MNTLQKSIITRVIKAMLSNLTFNTIAIFIDSGLQAIEKHIKSSPNDIDDKFLPHIKRIRDLLKISENQLDFLEELENEKKV